MSVTCTGTETVKENDHNSAMRAFTRLWLENQSVVSGFIYLNVRDFHHAEDIIQETARSAVDSFDRYDPQRPFAAWVIAIARQRIADHFRQQGRKRLTVSSEIVDLLGEACVTVAEEADERTFALRQCVDRLQGRHREVVELRYGKGLSTDAVAARLGLKTNAVNALVFRARKALAKCVDQHLGRLHA